MSNQKFSQFIEGGDCQVGDIVVGLRSGQNYQFTFPADGIKDQYGNYLLMYNSDTIAGPGFSNYPVLMATKNATGYITYTCAGVDGNISLRILPAGSGDIELITDGGYININNTQAINGITNDGTLSNNSPVTLPTESAVKTYVDSQVSGVVYSIYGVYGQIVISGTSTNPIIGIDPTYVGQTSITTLGTVTTGTWAASFTAGIQIPQPNILGRTNGFPVLAGSVGEVISSVVPYALAVPISVSSNSNITSITLSAGIWSVNGSVGMYTSSGSISKFTCCIDYNSLVISDGAYCSELSTTSGDISNIALSCPQIIVNSSSTTTLYLVVSCTNNTATGAVGFGNINAIRIG